MKYFLVCWEILTKIGEYAEMSKSCLKNHCEYKKTPEFLKKSGSSCRITFV